MTRADLLLAVYVLRALGYAVTPAEDIEGTRTSPRFDAALRQFQEAANREHGRRLRVDGVLGPDSLNALAFYASYSPYTVARLSVEGLTPEEQRAVQAVIVARRNNAWGGGAGGSANTGGGSSNTGGSSSSTASSSSVTRTTTTTQAGFFSGTPGKVLLVASLLGVVALGGSYVFKHYESGKVASGAWAPNRTGRRAPSQGRYPREAMLPAPDGLAELERIAARNRAKRGR